MCLFDIYHFTDKTLVHSFERRGGRRSNYAYLGQYWELLICMLKYKTILYSLKGQNYGCGRACLHFHV